MTRHGGYEIFAILRVVTSTAETRPSRQFPVHFVSGWEREVGRKKQGSLHVQTRLPSCLQRRHQNLIPRPHPHLNCPAASSSSCPWQQQWPSWR